jgi:hypothetical protein
VGEKGGRVSHPQGFELLPRLRFASPTARETSARSRGMTVRNRLLLTIFFILSLGKISGISTNWIYVKKTKWDMVRVEHDLMRHT